MSDNFKKLLKEGMAHVEFFNSGFKIEFSIENHKIEKLKFECMEGEYTVDEFRLFMECMGSLFEEFNQ